MADKPDITPELLRQLLRYNPKTGKLFWRKRVNKSFSSTHRAKIWNAKYAKQEAGCIRGNGGYRSVTVNYIKMPAHRIAWALFYGEWPRGMIDHINGVRTDNRLENIRDVTLSENARNSSRSTKNTSGHTGVSWEGRSKRWRAYIRENRKTVGLGYFRNIDDALKARKKAEIRLEYHPNHGREKP